MIDRRALGMALLAAMFSCESKSADTTEQASRRLAVSPSHACVIRSAGLYCWGDNFQGQLGTGSQTESTTAVEASVLHGDVGEVVEVAAATGRTCVRTRAGAIACWGMNDRGQAGDGTRADTLVPVAAKGIDDAMALAIDDESSCVIRAGHTVACWGGTLEGAAIARPIAGLTDIEELRAGSTGRYCARDARNAVWCWRSDDGQWAAPVELEALAGARAVAITSYDTVCALLEAGNVVCHNTVNGSTTALSDAEDVVSINAAGSLALCGRKRDGSWSCWNVLPPMLESVGSPAIRVPSDVALTELWIAGFRVCALREDQRVVCADANDVTIGLGSIAPTGLTFVEGLPD